MAPAHANQGRETDRRRLEVALALILAFMACEVAVGIVSHSLALLSDATHMLTDAAALGLAIVAARLAVRPPTGGLTFGLKRMETLAALANGTTLTVLAVLIVYEALRRLVHPPSPGGWAMLGVALAGIGVNILASLQLAGADRRSLNVRASFQHVMTDLYAFIGTAIAAVVILTTGLGRADAVASLVVAALVVRTAFGLVRSAGKVLLEGVPEGMTWAEIGRAMASFEEVVDVHDLHVWEITAGFPALSAHVLVRPGRDCHAVRRRIESMLGTRFGIEHTTLQVDHDENPVTLVSRSPH